MFYLFEAFGSPNNVIEQTISRDNDKVEYTYVFDSDGYPTKCTEKFVEGEDTGREFITTYQYK